MSMHTVSLDASEQVLAAVARKRRERSASASGTRDPRTPAPAPEPTPAPEPQAQTTANVRTPAIVADKLGYARCKPAISAPRTRNNFVPPAKANYAQQAREHIRALLKSKSGKAIVSDVQALTQSLITHAHIPADYVHAPHVRYWRKQVLELGK